MAHNRGNIIEQKVTDSNIFLTFTLIYKVQLYKKNVDIQHFLYVEKFISLIFLIFTFFKNIVFINSFIKFMRNISLSVLFSSSKSKVKYYKTNSGDQAGINFR